MDNVTRLPKTTPAGVILDEDNITNKGSGATDNDTASLFRNDHYLVVPDAVPREICEFGARQFLLLRDAGQLRRGDSQVEKSWCVYCQPLSETLLDMMTGPLSSRLGYDLAPTFSYTRVYEPGAAMPIHQDRKSSELTATLTLGYSTDQPWEIFLRNRNGKTLGFSLDQGELLIFMGHELAHWRDPWIAPEGSWQVQVFMHYVDANGPFKHTRFDGRSALCAPSNEKASKY